MKKSTDIKIKSHWLEIMQPFSIAVKGEVLAAVCDYVSTGQVPEMSEVAAVAFAFIRYEIDAAASRKAAAAARRSRAVAQKSDCHEPVMPEPNVPATAVAPPEQRRRPVDKPALLRQSCRRLPRKLKKRLKKQIEAAVGKEFADVNPIVSDGGTPQSDWNLPTASRPTFYRPCPQASQPLPVVAQ